MQRVFIVGCPRSGTTLVQAMLARHPDVFSLHETYFFEALIGDSQLRWRDREARATRKWYHRAGLAQSWGRRRLRQLERRHLAVRRGPSPMTRKGCVRRYVAMLDEAAARGGCTHWVEKTPNHILYLDEIDRGVPDVRVVHVLRRGIDVIASVIDADLRQGTAAFRGGVARWVRRWNHAMAVHMAHLEVPRHYLLCHEDLLADPDAEWARLRDFLDLDPRQPLRAAAGTRVADPHAEPWKAAAADGVVLAVDDKVRALFGPRTRAWLSEQLVDYGAILAAIHAKHNGDAVVRAGRRRVERLA